MYDECNQLKMDWIVWHTHIEYSQSAQSVQLSWLVSRAKWTSEQIDWMMGSSTYTANAKWRILNQKYMSLSFVFIFFFFTRSITTRTTNMMRTHCHQIDSKRKYTSCVCWFCSMNSKWNLLFHRIYSRIERAAANLYIRYLSDCFVLQLLWAHQQQYYSISYFRCYSHLMLVYVIAAAAADAAVIVQSIIVSTSNCCLSDEVIGIVVRIIHTWHGRVRNSYINNHSTCTNTKLISMHPTYSIRGILCIFRSVLNIFPILQAHQMLVHTTNKSNRAAIVANEYDTEFI